MPASRRLPNLAASLVMHGASCRGETEVSCNSDLSLSRAIAARPTVSFSRLLLPASQAPGAWTAVRRVEVRSSRADHLPGSCRATPHRPRRLPRSHEALLLLFHRVHAFSTSNASVSRAPRASRLERDARLVRAEYGGHRRDVQRDAVHSSAPS